MRTAGDGELGTGSNALKADINVTPLVDVCLVLLIIFMLVTPMLVDGGPVELPQTAHPEKMPEGAKQLDIAIRQDASVSIGPVAVPDGQILARLREIHDVRPDKTVVIKGDRRVDYAQVRKVMRLVNEAGFSGVGLVFQKKAHGG